MFYKLIEKLNNSKNHPYYYITPLVYAIGNASEQIMISSLKIKNKKIIILFPTIFKNFFKYEMCNKYLFNSLKINSFQSGKSFMKIIVNLIMNIEFFFRKIKSQFFSKIFKLKKNEYDNFPHVGIHTIYKKNFIKETFDEIEPIDLSNLNISLNKEKKLICEKILDNKKIPLNNIICLHVRDSGFKKDFNRKLYRNSNINNYLELIKYLIDKNYYVIRMGDHTSAKINFSNKNFLDYSRSEVNSRLMDLFLISECKFFVGNQSGIMDTAYMFNKPTLTTNMCEIFTCYPRKINDRGLFKKIKLKSHDTYLNLVDYIHMDYSKHDAENEVFDFDFYENSPEELYDSIVEFEKLHVLKEYTLSENQKKINEIIKKRFKASLYKEMLKSNDTFIQLENSKAALWVNSFKGSFCKSYLKKSF